MAEGWDRGLIDRMRSIARSPQVARAGDELRRRSGQAVEVGKRAQGVAGEKLDAVQGRVTQRDHRTSTEELLSSLVDIAAAHEAEILDLRARVAALEATPDERA